MLESANLVLHAGAVYIRVKCGVGTRLCGINIPISGGKSGNPGILDEQI